MGRLEYNLTNLNFFRSFGDDAQWGTTPVRENWVWSLKFNQMYYINRRGTHGGRRLRCGNCTNAHFLRGTVMKASSHEKHAKKTWKKNQIHVPCQASPQTLPMGLNFLFFLFSRGFGQTAKKQKTHQKKKSNPCPLPGLSPDLAHGSDFFFFGFLEVLAKLQKTMEKTKKIRPMSPARPLPRPCPWVRFFFFLFSRGFGQTAKNNGKTKKNKKFGPMSPARPLPRPCPWVWFFFCLFWPRFWPNCTKPWKNKKNKKKKSDPCPQPGLSPDFAHGSEFFVFFGFLEVLAKLQKPMEKPKKNLAQVPSQASPQTLPMGLNFLLFFVFFFGFSIFFCMFFMWICFHHSTSQKMRVSTICTPAPPRPNCKKSRENQTSFNDLYHD